MNYTAIPGTKVPGEPRRMATGIYDEENRLIILSWHAIQRFYERYAAHSDEDVLAKFTHEWMQRQWCSQSFRRANDERPPVNIWHCATLRIFLSVEGGESVVVTVASNRYGGVDTHHVVTQHQQQPRSEQGAAMHSSIAIESSAARHINALFPRFVGKSNVVHSWLQRQLQQGRHVGRNNARREDLIEAPDCILLVQYVRGATRIRDVFEHNQLAKLLTTYLPTTLLDERVAATPITAAIAEGRLAQKFPIVAQTPVGAPTKGGEYTREIVSQTPVTPGTPGTPEASKKVEEAAPMSTPTPTPLTHDEKRVQNLGRPRLNLSEAYWVKLILERDLSGASPTDIAEREHLPKSTYYNKTREMRVHLASMSVGERAAYFDKLGIKNAYRTSRDFQNAPQVTSTNRGPLSHATQATASTPTEPVTAPVTAPVTTPVTTPVANSVAEAPTATPTETMRVLAGDEAARTLDEMFAAWPTTHRATAPEVMETQTPEVTEAPVTEAPGTLSLAIFLGGAKPPSVFTSVAQADGSAFAVMMTPVNLAYTQEGGEPERRFYVLGIENRRVKGRLFDQETCALVLELLYQRGADDLLGTVYE